MATHNIYVYCDAGPEIIELRNSTYTTSVNAPGSQSNPVVALQGDTIRFNFRLLNGAAGQLNTDYNGTTKAASYWTNTSDVFVTVNNGFADKTLTATAPVGTNHAMQVAAFGETALVYFSIAAEILNDGDYGLEVFGPNGSSVVFSPGHRFGNSDGQKQSILNEGQNKNYDVPGANGTSSYAVIVLEENDFLPTITKYSTYYSVLRPVGSGEPGTPSIVSTMAVLVG